MTAAGAMSSLQIRVGSHPPPLVVGACRYGDHCARDNVVFDVSEPVHTAIKALRVSSLTRGPEQGAVLA
jgi:hypothetical protein